MATIKNADGPTPFGGVRWVIRFLNDDWEPVDEQEATQAIIIEFDKDDREIMRSYGRLRKSPCGVEEIDLAPWEEAALDAVWEKRIREQKSRSQADT